jgi:uncharacterized protein (DUF362 family)
MIDRRNFLKMGGMATMASATLPALKANAAVDNTKVYACYDANMVSGSTVNYSLVKKAVDNCLMAMAGKTTLSDAVKVIFPGITSSSKVAIKINCLNTNVSPPFESVKALVTALRTVVTASNIWLFDNQLWTTRKVDKAYGASNLDALGIWHGDDTYGSPTVSAAGRSYYVSQRLKNANFGISFAALKPHQYYCGGISGVIKNMMGAVSSSSGSSYGKPSGIHNNGCRTAFADLFRNYMNNKLQLYFMDMLYGTKHENYSSWTKTVKRISMSASPSRLDAYMVQVLKSVGLTDYSPNTSVPAAVGPINYSLVNVTTAGIEAHQPSGDLAQSKVLSASPNPLTSRTRITIQAEAHELGQSSLAVYDARGKLVEDLTSRVRQSGSRSILWNAAGRPSGVYRAVFSTGNRRFERELVIIK